MSVWFVCPSKRPPEEVEPILKLWRERGYNIAIQKDAERPSGVFFNLAESELTFLRPYCGYAEAVNYLTSNIINYDSEAQWIVCAGDDTEPDAQHSAEEIALQCEQHLYESACPKFTGPHPEDCPFCKNEWDQKTFGVMQPTGDKWGDKQGPYIERVAGSPWLGREFCLRVNQGHGPLWPEYFHMYADEELQHVATRLGVFWQRPDLIHLHKHWGRSEPGEPLPSSSLKPDFLKRANSAEEWHKAKKLFTERKAAGFPGSEPL